jgi:hypothetical protein
LSGSAPAGRVEGKRLGIDIEVFWKPHYMIVADACRDQKMPRRACCHGNNEAGLLSGLLQILDSRFEAKGLPLADEPLAMLMLVAPLEVVPVQFPGSGPGP